jgi:hypothetical protein
MGDWRAKLGADLSLSDVSTGMRENKRIVSSEKILEKTGMGSVRAASLADSGVSKVSEAFLIASHRSASSEVADSAVH